MAKNTGTAVGYSYSNITTQTTTVLRTGSGILHSITFNGPLATGTVAIYDNTAGSGTLIGTITVPASPMPITLQYDAVFDVGLTIVTGTANNNITVTFI